MEDPILLFLSQKDWESWLSSNHTVSKGIWLQISKKQSSHPSVTYQEALECALCFGWIDGQKKSVDDIFWIQRFTPRGSRSIWSKINREKALKLIEMGKMTPAGLQAIERAKTNGLWEKAYDSHSTAEIPADLQQALDANPEAAEFFGTLNSNNRFAILFRIHNVKKAETRAKKIETFVAMLARKEKLYP